MVVFNKFNRLLDIEASHGVYEQNGCVVRPNLGSLYNKKLNIIFVIFSLLSALCSCSDTASKLNEAGSCMIDDYNKALTILTEMDTMTLSEKQKAQRALLISYISVTWRIPIDIPEGDINRVMNAYVGDCSDSEVKSLIIKSEIENADYNPVARIEYLKDAEFLANQINDKTELAFIYLYLSQVYANGFNKTVSGYYANKSRMLFDELKHKKQSIDARMAVANSIDDNQIFLDSLLSMRSDVERYATDGYKPFYNDQLARALFSNNRSREAIEMWGNTYPDGTANSNTLAHWAQAYMLLNNLDSANVLIERALSLPHNNADEYLCRNVQYDICKKSGRQNELAMIDSLRSAAANNDFEKRQLEQSSLAMNQKYESATQKAWAEAQSAKDRDTIIIAVTILILIISLFIILYYRNRTRLLQMENENEMLKLERFQTDLNEMESRQDVLSKRISDLFKSRFDVIDKLAASYFECKETGNEQKKIFAEAKKLIGDFGNPESLHQLVEILNANRNDLMKRFDEDFPKISPTQRKLAIYIFCGLSLQSISVFMDTDLCNLYVYKSRLKSAISKSDIQRKDIYLEYFA